MELTILQDNLFDLNMGRVHPDTLIDLEPLLVAEFLHYYSELTIEEQFETYMKEVIKVVSYYTGYQLKPMLNDGLQERDVNLHASLYTYMPNFMLFDRLFMWRNELTEYKANLPKGEPISRTITFGVSIDHKNFEAIFWAKYE